MNIDRPTTKKQSLGKLRIVSKMNKEKSPNMTGTLRLQRHTAAAILEQFDSETSDVLCNVAGWVNQDHEGPYLTVEISTRFGMQTSNSNNLAFIFEPQDDAN